MRWFASRKRFVLGPVIVLGLGLLLALIDGTGHWVQGWVIYSLLLGLGFAAVYGGAVLIGERIKDGFSPGMKAAISAFFIRLIVGVSLTLLLPIAGYQDSEVTRAGYVFKDAYFRDGRAWKLAASDRPLGVAFTPQFAGDQYGGLLALSAGIYRYLSPDAHRQMLILILTASAAALGTLFLWKATRGWFSESVAAVSAWIFALYPESVILGSSQMREAFVISSVALAFCGLVQAQKGSRGWLAGILLALGVLLVIQPPIALVTILVLCVLWFLEPGRIRSWNRREWVRAGIFLGIVLMLALVVVSIWARLPSLQKSGSFEVVFSWLQNNFNFQSYKLERASGWMQKLLDEAGERWWPAIVISYGIAQPVLPATVFEPAAKIWTGINFTRALGWYLLAPVLIYALFASFRVPWKERRAQLIWLGLFTWLWVIISSANAGGDLIDNPRYRVIFLTWQALLAAWAWEWARIRKDAWLKRWFLIEAIFVLFFAEWYASRYTRLFSRLHFWEMIAVIVALGAIVLVGSWLWDRRVKSRDSQ